MPYYYKFLLLVALVFGGQVNAHQFTPTYPQFEPSFIDGVVQTKMELFNKRREVEYYELAVFDKDWRPVTFAASDNRIIQIGYLETKSIDIYIKNQDIRSVVYICTESRLLRDSVKSTVISSKICSKVKQ